MFALILALIAALVIFAASIITIAVVGPETARQNAVAAGIHLGGKHAKQPRLVPAHRAVRAEGEHIAH